MTFLLFCQETLGPLSSDLSAGVSLLGLENQPPCTVPRWESDHWGCHKNLVLAVYPVRLPWS